MRMILISGPFGQSLRHYVSRALRADTTFTLHFRTLAREALTPKNFSSTLGAGFARAVLVWWCGGVVIQ